MITMMLQFSLKSVFYPFFYCSYKTNHGIHKIFLKSNQTAIIPVPCHVIGVKGVLSISYSLSIQPIRDKISFQNAQTKMFCSLSHRLDAF